MKKAIAAGFFILLMGAMSCSSDPCNQMNQMVSGCGGSSTSGTTSNCNQSTNTLNCARGTHQQGNACVADK